MDADEAYTQNLISRSKKKRIDNWFVVSFFLALLAITAMIIYFGIGAASHTLVTARHNQFHAVVGTVNHKSALLGGPEGSEGELRDHYRLKVRFRDNTGAIRNPEEAISWQLRNRPTVRVYDGPGTTFDIPGAIEGSHPRNPDLSWLWAAGSIVALLIGAILGWKFAVAVEQLLLRPYVPKKQSNGPVPAT